jgi:formiminoglutamase
MEFQAIDRSLLFSRNDISDLRRGSQTTLVTAFKDLSPGFVIAGYPDDEGIRNNGGRPGATLGPDTIRKFLYRMVVTPNALYDVGNSKTANRLELRHEAVRQKVKEALLCGHRWIGLGGGHDYGFADGAGFLDWAKDKKPIVINFDAHLDVRAPKPEINSGTPFFRLKELGIDFEFVQIGIQRQCNSDAHFQWCEQHGIRILTLDAYWNSRLAFVDFVIKSLGDLLKTKRPCFLSVDIDAFAWPYAIGSSQSWPTGLEPKEFWPTLELFLKTFDVRTLGIYETSPPLDFDFGTAKLAALIADTFIRKAQ